MQDIYVWIDYLSITNPSNRSFFPRISLLMLWFVNASYILLLNYWVLSSFHYVWLICIHLYSSQALLCTLMSLQKFVLYSCFHNASNKISNYFVLLSWHYFIPHTTLPLIQFSVRMEFIGLEDNYYKMLQSIPLFYF